MTTDRCHACGAAVTAGAPWCTLCYADLREPVLAPASAPAAPQPAARPTDAMAAQFASRRTEPPLTQTGLEPDPILDAPVHTATAVATAPPGWPCGGCGARMPLDADSCTQCGQPFLPKEATPSLVVPGVGDVAKLDRGQRIMLIAGGAVALILVFVAFAYAAGSLL